MDVSLDDNAGTMTKYLNGSGVDNKLRQTKSTDVSYFLTDHLGSTNGMTNSSGAITSQTAYDSFGNATNTALPSRYQFTGREFDSFSGLQFSRARFYDPNLGRFISEDPIGFGGGDVNLYGYVKNNSINRTDPLGLFDQGNAEAARRAAELAAKLAAGGGGVAAAGGGGVAAAGGGGVAAAAVGGLTFGAVAVGGLAAGYGIGYYPGQALARYFYPNQFPDTQTSPQTAPQTATSRPTCQAGPKTTPFYRIPPFSNPFSNPYDDDDKEKDRDICGRLTTLCLNNPRQPDWNRKQYGARQDCGACDRECRANGGAWPFYKCPLN